MTPGKQSPETASDNRDRESSRPQLFHRIADVFIIGAAAFYALAALAMASVSLGLITLSVFRLYTAIATPESSETVLLDAVSSLVISVAVLDVAKYVMEEEVLRSRELRRPREAREAVTKFMVIIALVVSIEGIVLVFELGRSHPELLLYPIMLLCVSVIIVVGLGVFQRLSLKSEQHLKREADDAAAAKPL
ncbi:hypothetical protein [Ruegeria marina]|uniref:N-linked glycosylation glycosyltransferase PglG n=1 Tax=Ruegeria marina TaxID=639004 RepID=A0A1G6I736_9RHOB|nr:hypothetical protein [Ruegeria marina]SDC02260.1 hypothetical protein SAMN04488239_10143 [Ruegeria marina]